MSMSEHPDIDALSGYIDGEPAGYEPHISGCQACQAQVAALESVRAAVGLPPPAPRDERRERAIARALHAARAPAGTSPVAGPSAGPGAVSGGEVPTSIAWRRWRPLVTVGSVAAVLLGVLLAVSVLRDGGGRGGATDTAARPLNEAGDGQATPPAPAVREAGDLGDVGDVGTLVAKVNPPEGFTTPSAGSDNAVTDGKAGAASGTASPQAEVARSAPPAIPSPREVGTRPCEVEVRLLNQTLGPVLYYATARWQGTPAVVLGFAPRPDVTGPLNLFVLAQGGCRTLAQATTP